jgi:hypothetical protein
MVYHYVVNGTRLATSFGAALLAATIYWLVFSAREQILHGNTDFSCFYRAGRMVLTGQGSEVYDLSAEQAFDAGLRPQIENHGQPFYTLPYVFTPPSLALFTPLALLPYRTAETVWFLFNIAVLIGVPFVLSVELELGVVTTCASVLLPAFFPPVLMSLLRGQVSALILGAFALFFLCLRRNHPFAAGCWLAASLVKPQFTLVALLLLLVDREWEALKGFAVVAGCLLFLSFGLVGIRTSLMFPLAVANYTRLGFDLRGSVLGEHPDDMPNLRGLAYHLSSSSFGRATLTAFLSVLVIAALVWLRRKLSLEACFPLLIVTTLLVSPHTYSHDYVLLVAALPPALSLVRRYRGDDRCEA